MEILENLFRTLMFGIDKVAYGLIPTIYKLFVYLSELNLYSDDPSNPLHQLVNHIYVLLGIFMLFKVSFSLLQYIVDPNAFRDSSKGFGKLVTNVLVAMVLLVTVPYIFSFASKLQSVIVQENVIGQLILGTSAGSSTGGVKVTADKAEEMATDLQFMLYGAFYNINTDIVTECEGSSGVLGSVDMALTDGCLDGLNSRLSEYSDAASNGVNLRSFFKYTSDDEDCNGVCDDRNFEHFDKLLWWKEDGTYVINYMPIISAAAGIYVALLLISFSVDVAVRAIKLCFLQMVAPIAIVSYIDPKEQISNGKLYNWIKETASTYFSLFLRLATIFLVMLLIEMIANSILASGGGENYIDAQIPESGYNIWIYLFLVIGAFMFAKQVPKIIESIFGIKGSGDFNLNPFKNAGVAALTGGAVGLGIGVAGAVTGSGVTRIATGTLGGFKSGLSGKKIGEIAGMQADTNRRMGMAKANGSTFWGRQGARFSSLLGTPGAMGRIISTKENMERRNQLLENYANTVNGIEDDARSKITSGEAGSLSKEYFQRNEMLNQLRQQNEIRQQTLSDLQHQYNSREALNYTYTDTNPKTGETETINVMLDADDVNYDRAYQQQYDRINADITAANNEIISSQIDNNEWLKETATYSYIEGVQNGTIEDAKLTGRLRDGEVYARQAEITWEASPKDRHRTAGITRGRISDSKRENADLSERERVAQANVEAVQGKPGGARRGPGRFGPGPGGFGPSHGGPRGPRH